MSKNWAHRDVLGDDAADSVYPTARVVPGLELTHRPSRVSGAVASFTEGERVVLIDQDGNRHEFKPHPGVMLLEGRPVRLIAPASKPTQQRTLTPSGSIYVGPVRARKAAASRIWVEGIHDAELVEKIWGDDLRLEGIVVEPLHGVDDLLDHIVSFRPGSNRRLGVLLDHMRTGTKESHLAAQVSDPNVLVLGHPYVDIWAAIHPEVVGIGRWPEVPRGIPWKEGVMAVLGAETEPGVFWGQILDRVSSYRDVATPLVNAVEQRAVIQRVARASVTVDGEVVGRIGQGLLALVGVGHDDGEPDAAALVAKMLGLRIFPDSRDKMNLSVEEIGGEVLVVSQFTLLADARKGRRPSFTAAAEPARAAAMVDRVVALIREGGVEVKTGTFGAMMEVELLNAGPVTIVLDARDGRIQ